MLLFPRFSRPPQKKFDPSAETERRLVENLSIQRIPTLAQLRYLPSFLHSNERKLLRAFSATLATGVLLFIGIHLFTPTTTPTVGGVYREGLLGNPQYLNPLFASVNEVDTDLTRLIFRRLLAWNDAGVLVPDLAEHYTVSRDGKTYTVRLKHSITWQDKELVTTDDVVYTYETIQNPQFASPLRTSLGRVKIERLGDFEIAFHLEEPFVRFPELLTIGILPEHLWADTPPEAFPLSPLNRKPVGNGPFIFESLTKDGQGRIKKYALVRNPNAPEPHSYLDRIEFHFFPTTSEVIRAFKARNIDGIKYAPEKELRKLAGSSSVQMHEFRIPQYVGVFFNLQKNSIVKDTIVRNALTLSIDRQELLTNARSGAGVMVQTPILPGQIGYDPAFHARLQDIEKAKQLLEALGWKPGADGIRTKENVSLVFTLTTGNTPELVTNANLLQKTWQKIGVDLRVEIMDTRDALEKKIMEGSYDALLIGKETNVDPDPFSAWHSSQITRGTNLSRYSNRSMDATLEEARKEHDRAKRTELYHTFQKKFLEDLPALVLYNPFFSYLTDAKIKGIPENALINGRSERFASIERWYIKTKKF